MIRRFAYLLGCAAFVVANLTPHSFIASSAQAEVPVPRGYTEAMQWYRNAAREGDAKAMFYLGLTLEQGLQGEARPGEAFEWYRKSAGRGLCTCSVQNGHCHTVRPTVAGRPARRTGLVRKGAGAGRPGGWLQPSTDAGTRRRRPG